MNKKPTAHKPQFSKVKSFSPLAQLINAQLDTPDMKRIRFYARFLDAFHLKNTVTTQVTGRLINLNGREVINFSSANYLGFDQHPAIIESAIHGIKKFGNHSGCSRMFSSHVNILALEEEISKLVGAEKTQVCVNVSQIHEGAIPALFTGSDTTLFIDKYAHTSMYQAAMIAKAKGTSTLRVDIGDRKALEKTLKENRSQRKALLIDGIYSMHGHMPDIKSIQSVCDETNTILYIDDAHGIGIYGDNGGGVAEELQLNFDNMILVGSLQKGFGAFGAFISGHGSMIDILRASSKSYIFSGTLQPQAVESARAAIQLSKSDKGRLLRAELKYKSKMIRVALQEMGFKVPSGDSPIIPVHIGADIKTLLAGRKLFDEGIYLNSVLFPAVPKNAGILRISLTAIHSENDIQTLLEGFRSLKVYLQTHSGPFASIRFLKEIALANLAGDRFGGL